MPRTRYQRGTLRTSIPARSGKPEHKLPRGAFWSRWNEYIRCDDGTERIYKREKIITKELAAQYGIATGYEGPLNKGDAQRVLDALIARGSGNAPTPRVVTTLASVAREYLTLAQPNWGAHMVRVAGILIEKHICGSRLGMHPIAEITEAELQEWLNGYVSAGASKSMLRGLLLHIRAIFKHGRKRRIITDPIDPTEDLRAKSKKERCERTLSLEECSRLLSAVTGRDHLILRIAIQLGLRPEELFALRRDDVIGNELRVDEALVEGRIAATKTPASKDSVYVPPDLQIELREWMDNSEGKSSDWLFHPSHGRKTRGPLNLNNYRERILQAAAIRAGIGVSDTSKKDKKGNPIRRTDVTFQALRRTCATHFGDRAKDPKSTQKQMRHSDAGITLKFYQKAIPENVKAAAIAFEAALLNAAKLNTSGLVLGRSDVQ